DARGPGRLAVAAPNRMNLVVKLGGDVLDGDRLPAIASDLVSLMAAGHRVMVVHGGGPQVTELSKRFGIEPQIVGGRRVTDGPTLDVLEMVLGRLNVELCARLRAAGAAAVGLHDAVRATRRPPVKIAGAGDEPI